MNQVAKDAGDAKEDAEAVFQGPDEEDDELLDHDIPIILHRRSYGSLLRSLVHLAGPLLIGVSLFQCLARLKMNVTTKIQSNDFHSTASILPIHA